MKELTNKMKATTAITISLVITLSLLLFAGGLVGSINNVLAKKDGSGSGRGGDKSGGDKGGSDKGTTHQASSDGGGSKGNDNNNNNNGDNSGGDGGSSTSIATETRKPGSDFHGGLGLVSATCGAFKGKCMHPGDGMTTTSPISPSGPVSCHKECGGGTPTPPVSTVTCNPGHHFVQTLGCVKDHLTHDEAFDLGCKLGTNDGEDQENFVGTGPHSSGFIRGYNQGFAGHSCDRHHGSSDGGSGNGINTVSGTTIPQTTTTTATKTTTTPVFKESTDIPVSTNVAVGPTTKTVDTAGWLHMVGDIKNNGKSSVTIEPQISGRVMNANNKTIRIEYATPLSTTIQPGQSTAFEMLVGGTGIPNLSDIASIQYHVGIVGSSK